VHLQLWFCEVREREREWIKSLRGKELLVPHSREGLTCPSSF
jgi:hypothetical protein